MYISFFPLPRLDSVYMFPMPFVLLQLRYVPTDTVLLHMSLDCTTGLNPIKEAVPGTTYMTFWFQ